MPCDVARSTRLKGVRSDLGQTLMLQRRKPRLTKGKQVTQDTSQLVCEFWSSAPRQPPVLGSIPSAGADWPTLSAPVQAVVPWLYLPRCIGFCSVVPFGTIWWGREFGSQAHLAGGGGQSPCVAGEPEPARLGISGGPECGCLPHGAAALIREVRGRLCVPAPPLFQDMKHTSLTLLPLQSRGAWQWTLLGIAHKDLAFRSSGK